MVCRCYQSSTNLPSHACNVNDFLLYLYEENLHFEMLHDLCITLYAFFNIYRAMSYSSKESSLAWLGVSIGKSIRNFEMKTALLDRGSLQLKKM